MIPLGVVSNKANALYNNHHQSNGSTNNNLGEMTITELQEIALRQQQQIDINHQLLLAREKRLNILKLEEARNQQLTLLTNSLSSAALNSNSNNQFQVGPAGSNGKQNALSQELKIFKLKQLRSQLLDSKLSNSNMCSELDLIKTLFKDKEKDLSWAMTKVEELKRQIEQLGGLRASNRVGPTNNKVHHVSSSTSNITELERLKQELQIRNKLNEQQSKKIQQQQDLFNRKQLELIELDKRIDELKTRIRNKRHRLQAHHHQQHQLNHETLEREIAVKSMQMMNENIQSDSANTPANIYQQHTQNVSKSSPSKVVAKFASKQEIANTYMNRSEAFQKYRMMQNTTPQFNTSNTHPSPSNMMVFSPSTAQPEEIENSSTSSASMNNNPSNVINNPASSTSSLGSLSSPVPLNNKQQAESAANSSLNNDTTSAASTSITLPSHLKLEFDKMKYLPDVVKTIKKRHSISEIEGSGNTIPPFIVQKLLEKHKEFNQPQQQQQQQQSASQLQQQASFNSLSSVSSNNSSTNTPLITSQNSSSSSIKLSKIPEATNEGVSSSSSSSIVKQQQQAQIIPIVTNTQSNSNNNSANGNSTKLTTFLPSVKDSQVLPTIKENPTTVNEQQPSQIEIVTEPSLAVKSTKSIIKQTNNNATESGENGETISGGAETTSSGRRVNFDPHALLLDAAVEGELDLVMKCARLVGNISEPNDEGITALHNSVCAGHFEIVKFLVEAGCDVNYADNDGWTPLHCAASCNNLQMLRFLIENGASVFATTLSDNETAARKCEEDEQGYQACFEYLKMIEKNVGDTSVNGGLVHTLYSYEREQDDELSFECGDKMIVVDKHDQDPETEDGWWTCRLVNGKSDDADQQDQGPVGLVPKNYLGLYPRIQPKLLISSQEESTIC